MKEIKISIIGFGSIGKGLVREIIEKRDFLLRKGYDLKVVAIADKNSSEIDINGLDLANVLKKEEYSYNKTALDIIYEVKQDIMVECTPSNIIDGNPGLSHILAALNSRINVVTSNKGPFVVAYDKIIESADKNNVSIGYEATVGGAIPIINLIKSNIRADKILSIKGILNGTCNYILTRMQKEMLDYEEALFEAKELGIAETDESYDVKGIDTASKLVILANSLMKMNVKYTDVKVEGITRITREALELAEEIDCTIKLIGEVNKEERLLRVAPRLVPFNHPLSVGGTLNVIMLNTDIAGEITITGRGAGPKETSSAILSDIINIADERL
ncbi:MAG: homoserine dehydrogenase [Candidatus Methanoliparum thermophilum]|uniref:Homoserine dehydrogenase n=1 Tax=Methanoliparum thermophilum TaxID=2491083 RepID=A0A520KSR4_METT2|nr:homoserine dehydrogenase [Candidatus Methanoliparum sp. LAM-1]RZN64951.1 MAG: homoserine dehydrogenase [Candidatus Methanoliparum thermophilum]BDC36166.1 homoserine dehydrogenase [Candidatus Methanoliparum sp. LAM-1]